MTMAIVATKQRTANQRWTAAARARSFSQSVNWGSMRGLGERDSIVVMRAGRVANRNDGAQTVRRVFDETYLTICSIEP
ncbi:MAG: hypothetical protein B7Z55_14520 [Planctomycetales bacterium 12-60-4]|nr:MAG: hypothetical protein B7Z55_14520 [Planctomycetales bacterium 12-60-4]